ncbi:hypothetical protein Ccrd_010965 [Cynara cardunculus var. scolymus]|uniref:Uncharacterized protein n=1 Tax=Cynara cardunculus var. scolymus TaxID=59895 RepID=A0A103YKF8_CYNCS|nr:hypothetical protein Ccrd_010965 [Cynara cardunculus var. scolymus]
MDVVDTTEVVVVEDTTEVVVVEDTTEVVVVEDTTVVVDGEDTTVVVVVDVEDTTVVVVDVEEVEEDTVVAGMVVVVDVTMEGASVAARSQRQLHTSKLRIDAAIGDEPSFPSRVKKMIHHAILQYVLLIHVIIDMASIERSVYLICVK